MNEATEAFKMWKAAKENKEQIEQERNDRKPAPFKFVKVSDIICLLVHRKTLFS